MVALNWKIGIPAGLQANPHLPATVEIAPEAEGHIDPVQIETLVGQRQGSSLEVETVEPIPDAGSEPKSIAHHDGGVYLDAIFLLRQRSGGVGKICITHPTVIGIRHRVVRDE